MSLMTTWLWPQSVSHLGLFPFFLFSFHVHSVDWKVWSTGWSSGHCLTEGREESKGSRGRKCPVSLRKAGTATQGNLGRGVKGSWEEAQSKYKHKYDNKKGLHVGQMPKLWNKTSQVQIAYVILGKLLNFSESHLKNKDNKTLKVAIRIK